MRLMSGTVYVFKAEMRPFFHIRVKISLINYLTSITFVITTNRKLSNISNAKYS